MASAITHFVVGAGLALPCMESAALRAVMPRWAIPVTAGLFAVAPDLDTWAMLALHIPHGSFFSHRGFFHSPFFLTLLALAVASLVVRSRAVFLLVAVWAGAAPPLHTPRRSHHWQSRPRRSARCGWNPIRGAIETGAARGYDSGIMPDPSNPISRRSLLTAGAAAFTIVQPHLVRGAGKEKLRAGLVGCGGRGTQATMDLLTGNENVELVAMADVFEDHLELALKNLRDPKYLARHAGITVERDGKPKEMSAQDLAESIQPRIKVAPDRHFVGFDAYQKLAKSDLDIVMLATPPGYRPIHFEAAVEAGKHVFTEKPIATDATGVRRFLAAGRKAAEKKLTVMSGAQRHEDRPYVETVRKIHDGAIGDIVALQANYLSGPVMHAQARDAKWGDMEWEHRNWYSFLWLCGDQIVEQHFHNIDFMNWVMGTHPERVVASGGAAWRPRAALYGNIFDHMSSDFVYPNGVHLSSYCRQYPNGTYREVSDRITGTKGRSTGLDLGTKGISAYVQEHIDMVDSIQGRGPYVNQSVPIAESTLTCIMARESAYSGQAITWEQIMNSKQDLIPREFGYQTTTKPTPLPVPGEYKFV